jgi:hypothetical protein
MNYIQKLINPIFKLVQKQFRILHATKVVDIVTRNPEHFGLYYFNFPTILYQIYKLQSQTTITQLFSYKQVPKVLH